MVILGPKFWSSGFTSNNADINDCRIVSDLAFSDLEVASLGILDGLDGRLDHLDVDVVAVLAGFHIGQLYDCGTLDEEKSQNVHFGTVFLMGAVSFSIFGIFIKSLDFSALDRI